MLETLKLETAARKAGLLPHPRGISKHMDLPVIRAPVLGAANGQRQPVFAPRTLLCLWHAEAAASSAAVQALALLSDTVIQRFNVRVIGLVCAGNDSGASASDALFLWTDGNSTLTSTESPRKGQGQGQANGRHHGKQSAAVTHLALSSESYYSLLNHFGLHFVPHFIIVGADGHVSWSGAPAHTTAQHLSERLAEGLAEAFPMEEALSKSPYAKPTSVPKQKGRRPRNGR
jgi:hypothetical protein